MFGSVSICQESNTIIIVETTVFICNGCGESVKENRIGVCTAAKEKETGNRLFEEHTQLKRHRKGVTA